MPTSLHHAPDPCQSPILLPGPSELSGLPTPAEAATPEDLAQLHPAWAADVTALEPWGQGTEGGWCGGSGTEPAIRVLDAVGSTQDVLRGLAGREGGLPTWSSLVAARQVSGRGQLGRGWSSTPGNLYVSLVWPTMAGPWAEAVSLVAGLAVAEGLDGLGYAVSVKWPNDILSGPAGAEVKAGGILVEERSDVVLVGIGLNLVTAPGAHELRAGHAVPAGLLQRRALGGAGEPDPSAWGPLRLWCALLPRLHALVDAYLTDGFPAFRERFARRMAFMGRTVQVRDGASLHQGRLLGLANDGGLRISKADGETGGELVLYSGSLLPL